MRSKQHQPGFFASRAPRLLGGFFVSAAIMFGVGVYATHSSPTTKTDETSVTVGIHKNEAAVSMASAAPDYESTVLSFDPFNAVGLQWTGTNPENIHFELRTKDGGTWSPWEEVHAMGGESKDGGRSSQFSTNLLFQNGTKVQFRVRVEGTASIQNVNVLTIDSEAPIQDGFVKMTSLVTSQGTGLNVIKRSQWGADESYRYSGDDVVWPASKDTWEKFIVHHTAGSDGGSDPAASVRAIYYYHAVVLGWGDIGYNFLVDPDGNIYQGRYGGDDIIGGHTYNSATHTNFNEGSMGVAVLGCYEGADGACATEHEYNSAIKKGLGKLIGTKAAARNIDPQGSSTFHGEKTKNVIGHTDVDYTYCPGNNIHDKLTGVRAEAAAVVEEINNTGDYVGVFKSHTFAPATFTGYVQDVTIKYKNTGTRTWNQDDIMLKLYDETGKDRSQYHHNSWEDFYGGFRMDQDKVAPGEIASFTFKVKTPNRIGEHKQISKLFIGTNQRMEGERGVITTRVDATLMGYLADSTFPVAIIAGWKPMVSMTFRNDGIELWNDRTALFVNGQQVAAITSDIQPGQDATFVFQFDAPTTPGHYSIPVELRRDGDISVPGTRTVQALRVD